MRIALVNIHTAAKTYLSDMDGKPTTYATRQEALYQIECLKSTSGWSPREPVNFRYVIEPNELAVNLKIPATLRQTRILSTKVGRAMGRIQYQAVIATNPDRQTRLTEAWKRLNAAWNALGDSLGYLYCS